MQDFRHQPFWCEENIWHLCQDARFAIDGGLVAIVTGIGSEVAIWQQRAAAPGRAVAWDYHVLAFSRAAEGWLAWDLDSRLGAPIAAAAWIPGSFPCPERVPEEFQPRFRLVAAADYVAGLASDRSHMRRADGGWQQPPPSWPPPGGGGCMNLHEWLAPEGGRGAITDLAGLRRRFT